MTPRIEHVFEDGVEKRWCGKCKVFKPLDKFGCSKSTWDKYRPTCKGCLHADNTKAENKAKITAYNKQYWQDTKQQQKIKHKEWVEKNKDYVKQKMKEWLENNKEYKKQSDKLYREANWDKIKERNRKWKQKRYMILKETPSFAMTFAQRKIKSNISRRIREILGHQKSDAAMKYTGCSLEKLRINLERTMSDGMCWRNYGSNPNGGCRHCWHIDHILPAACFDMTNVVEQKACFHYRNLRALWWDENIQKKDSFDPEKKKNYMRWFIETQIPHV